MDESSPNRSSRLIGRSIADRYCITGTIGTGGMGQVFKAIAFDDPSHEIAIKVVLRNRKLSSDDLLRFQKEAALMARLHHPNIIYFHELGILESQHESVKNEFGNGYYIVMEVANGLNLKDHMSKGGRKDLGFFFDLGIQIASALDYTHGKNIIHRDIKPQNIIVGPSTLKYSSLNVKILDFGVARLVDVIQSTEHHGMKEIFEDVAGTPMYMAPEQTQYLKAPKDHRVDLYSLGCVLYEVLTGRPPFTAKSRDKIEREHVYSQPEPLRNIRPDIPIIVEQMILKLLEKNPKDRYQTAFSFLSDLQKAKRYYDKGNGTLPNFSLGTTDRFQAVSAQIELIGRDQELSTLISTYSAAAAEKSRSRMSVISGVAGSGKTKLLAEFRSYLLSKRVRFVSTSFSKHENALPFNALANGFNEYLTKIRKNYPLEAEEIRRRIRTVLGPVASQVASVVPGLKAYLSKEFEDNTEPPDEQSFQSFTKAFSDFTRCLAVDSQPIVFIFDDLHWADEKSLDLIDEFFSHNNSQSFVMVVSHRISSDTSELRFGQLIDKFRKLKRRFNQIELKALEKDSVKQIVENMLSDSHSVEADFLDYIIQKTQANPLHLVEYVRTLVARNFLYLKANSTRWEYDLELIKRSKITLDTIDLVLGRIQSFKSFDRKLLEVASVAGMSFRMSLLSAFEPKNLDRIHESLQKALDEGIITLARPRKDGLNNPEMEYSFSHPRIRETIYEGISIQDRPKIHELLLSVVEHYAHEEKNFDGFSLAHHVNQAFLISKQITNLGAYQKEKLIRYNFDAGLLAWKSGSYQSAQRYFENAYLVIRQDPKSVSQERGFSVLENLADLIAIQKRHSEAIKSYKTLMSWPASNYDRARIAHKIAYYQLVGGYLSNSLKQISEVFSESKFPLPKPSILSWSRALLTCFWHVLPWSTNSHPLVKALRIIYQKVKFEKKIFDSNKAYARSYETLNYIYLRQNPKISFLVADLSYALVKGNKLNLTDAIRVIGNRGVWLAYIGFLKTGFMILEKSIRLAQAIKANDTYGYLLFQRVVYLDYLYDKNEELQFNWKQVRKFLSPHDDQVAYGQALTFEMWINLLKGDLPRLFEQRVQIPDTIPTRSFVAPRAYSIYLFGLLLADRREHLVFEGERFIERRHQLKARHDDVFIRLIQSMVTFAKGEIDKTREYFKSLTHSFAQGLKREFLLPFEEDLVALFLVSFPVIFENEYKRRIMRDLEMKDLAYLIQRRVDSMFGRDRAILKLIRAKVHEDHYFYNIMGFYDKSLKASKAQGYKLVTVFSYLWFGDYLMRHGRLYREDYLRKAQALSHGLKLKAITDTVEKLMDKKGLNFTKAKFTDAKYKSSFLKASNSSKERLSYDHLSHLVQVVAVDSSLEQNFEESLDIIKRYVPFQNACVVLVGTAQNHQILCTNLDVSESMVLKYVESYFGLRSTLFLPASDAPWSESMKSKVETSILNDELESNFATSPSSNFAKEDVLQTKLNENTVLVEATIVQAANEGVETKNLSTDVVDSELFKREGDSYKKPGLQDHVGYRTKMNAVIPIRLNQKSIGIVFLQGVRFKKIDPTSARQELDYVGAQLALLLDKKRRQMSAGLELQTLRDLYLQQGAYLLEPVHWLKIWSHGKLRASREAVWYLGLNLNKDQYLLVYCRCNGELVLRERVSSMIWHHIVAVQSLIYASGRSRVDSQEMKEELHGIIQSIQAMKELQEFALSFTIFNCEKHLASSGHFGPSRPVVLGKNNLVSPQNDVILSFNNGIDLRYWSVTASTEGVHAYFMTHDSSKLDASYSESQSKAMVTNLLESKSNVELNKFLEKFIPQEQLPRYYLAAVQVSTNSNLNTDNDEFEGLESQKIAK